MEPVSVLLSQIWSQSEEPDSLLWSQIVEQDCKAGVCNMESEFGARVCTRKQECGAVESKSVHGNQIFAVELEFVQLSRL